MATPELSEQTRGWLRFIWQKATTPDDWSSEGEPHEWWDRESSAPMCSFPRFDLGETAYILPVAADITPAWREVYTRIADELVGRHTTFWAAVDWLTMIGHDPDQANYPPEWQVFMPDKLRGRYNAPGWVGNGIAPWGLQPDPIGADGNLFFRGFFNLLLSIYKSVSGDEKWEQPFAVTGYQNRRFDWTHYDIARFIHDQWAERPQGMQCENTKIWPFCLSAAGLGLQLYDQVSPAGAHDFHGVYDDWVRYAQKHYLVKNTQGDMTMFPLYYDPLEEVICSVPDPLVAYASLVATPYIVPQAPEFGAYLYEQSVKKLGWNSASGPVLDILPDPRFLIIGLLVARDLGDHVTEQRLREAVDRRADPRWFGPENSQFGYWFGLDEPYPRGQLSALLMACETGPPGAWSSAFREPNRSKFYEPTVLGIDYPAVDVLRAYNDASDHALHLSIAPGLASREGSVTTFRVNQLADTSAIDVRCDDEPYTHWRVVSGGEIEIETRVALKHFRITTRGSSRVKSTTSASASSPATQGRSYVPEAASKCSCC